MAITEAPRMALDSSHQPAPAKVYLVWRRVTEHSRPHLLDLRWTEAAAKEQAADWMRLTHQITEVETREVKP